MNSVTCVHIIIMRKFSLVVATCEIFTSVKIRVVFWVVTPCGVVVGHRRFGGHSP